MAYWFSLSGIGAGALWCLCRGAAVVIRSLVGVVYCGLVLGLGGSFSWAGGSARAPRLQGFVLRVGGSWGLWVFIGLGWPFRAVGGPVGCVQSRELGARALPSEVYLPGKLLCHFTCGFDFVHSLLLPFEAALAVLKRLNGKKKN